MFKQSAKSVKASLFLCGSCLRNPWRLRDSPGKKDVSRKDAKNAKEDVEHLHVKLYDCFK
jgi:hypothetical protein